MNTSSLLVRVCPQSHERYVRLPIFGRRLEDFVGWSLGKGYKHETVRLYLYALRRLVPALRRRGIQSSRDLTANDVQATARRFRQLCEASHKWRSERGPVGSEFMDLPSSVAGSEWGESHSHSDYGGCIKLRPNVACRRPRKCHTLPNLERP